MTRTASLLLVCTQVLLSCKAASPQEASESREVNEPVVIIFHGEWQIMPGEENEQTFSPYGSEEHSVCVRMGGSGVDIELSDGFVISSVE